MNIYGKKVVLRAIEKSDAELIVSLFNDPNIENNVVGWAFPVSVFSQEKWMEHNQNDNNNQRFIIEVNNESIGVISLTQIDWKNRSASYGIKLLNSERKKGHGTDATLALLRYAFDELGLHRLNTTILTDNDASVKLHEKCGWTIEGTKKSSIFKNGIWKDLYIVGILEEDYRNLIQSNNYWN